MGCSGYSPSGITNRVVSSCAATTLKKAAKTHVEWRSIRLATDFHVLLGEMADSPILLKFLREIVCRCGLTLAMYSRPHSAECGINEYLDLVDALAAADEKTATKLMMRHLETSPSLADQAFLPPKAVAEAIAHYRETLGGVLAEMVPNPAGPLSQRIWLKQTFGKTPKAAQP